MSENLENKSKIKFGACECENLKTERISRIYYGEKDWSARINITYCVECGEVKYIDPC